MKGGTFSPFDYNKNCNKKRKIVHFFPFKEQMDIEL
jgi:hypothetical protein